MNNQNSMFLTPAVMSACNEARTNYMDVLVRQQSASQPVDWLRRIMQQSQSSLDNYWQVALASATTGNVQDSIALLACIIREWGQYRAFQDLIDADLQGVNLNPRNLAIVDDLRRDFQRAVGNEVTALATELTNAWFAGRAEREKAGQNELVQGYSELHSIAMQVIHQRDTSLQSAQQTNQQYADIALQGLEQAKQGVVHMYEFMTSTQSNVVGMQQAFQNHLEQRLPSAIADASRKRTPRLLLVVLGICALVVLLFIVASVLGPTIIQR